MSFDVYTRNLNDRVVNTGTFTFPYAAGKTAASYQTGGAKLFVNQTLFTEDADQFDVAYGVSLITITYKSATPIEIMSKVSLQAPLDIDDAIEGDQTVDGDITATGGISGATVTTPNLLTSTGVGTVAGATVVAEEHGDGLEHITKLTLTAFAVGIVSDSVNLAIGAKIYTLPAGAYVIESASLVGALTGAGATKTDTPEVGIGTVIASGAVATLATATFENVMDGGASGLTGDADAVAPDINGTTFQKGNLSTARPIIEASGGLARDLFLNAADGWAATSAGVLSFTGVITLKWRKIN